MRKKRRRESPDGVRRVERKMEQLLEMPSGALSGNCHMEFYGNRQAMIEGCRGVLEYEEGLVRLSTDTGILKFTGRSLSLTCLTGDSAVISGFILSVTFGG